MTFDLDRFARYCDKVKEENLGRDLVDFVQADHRMHGPYWTDSAVEIGFESERSPSEAFEEWWRSQSGGRYPGAFLGIPGSSRSDLELGVPNVLGRSHHQGPVTSGPEAVRLFDSFLPHPVLLNYPELRPYQ